jgi:serine/threonine protein kinase
MSSWSRQFHLELLDARTITSSQRHIIPEDRVRLILTAERVQSLLVDEFHIEPALAEQLAAVVVNHAAKVLAILVCIGRTSSLLNHFIYPQFWDAKLPFDRSNLPSVFAEQFLTEQHHFLAPVFVPRLFADWKPETILPFVYDEAIGDTHGSFSTLHKIEIIPQFQKLVDSNSRANPGAQTVYFARKELRTERRNGSSLVFQREKHTLELLNLIRHPHIVPLLASYIHDDKFNMIFPLADSDLAAYLEGRYDVFIDDNSLWLELLGMTSALASLHCFRYTQADGLILEKTGYHHDLKPDNILIISGTLSLADFGLACLKATSEDSATENKHGTATYGAPELQSRDPRLKFSRALDIWSWGCIILEVLTFMLLGSRGVHDFRHYRRTELGMRIDYYFHDMVDLKLEVKEWIDVLRETALGQNYHHKDLLNGVLAISQTMLASDPRSRPPASAILQEFQALYRRQGILQNDTEACVNLSVTANSHEPFPMSMSLPTVLPQRRVNAEDVLENLADILEDGHPVLRAVWRSVNSQSTH